MITFFINMVRIIKVVSTSDVKFSFHSYLPTTLELTLNTFDILLLIFVAIIALSLIYHTVKLGISPMPSSNTAYQAMLALVNDTGTGTVIDLGSGWGNFVVRLAKSQPQRQVIGYELSFMPWIVSVGLKKLLRLQNLHLYRKDFFSENLAKASVLVCYLHPEAMTKVAEKLSQEQPQIDFLISNNFALPTAKASKKITLDDFYKSPIYLYKMPQKSSQSIRQH